MAARCDHESRGLPDPKLRPRYVARRHASCAPNGATAAALVVPPFGSNSGPSATRHCSACWSTRCCSTPRNMCSFCERYDAAPASSRETDPGDCDTPDPPGRSSTEKGRSTLPSTRYRRHSRGAMTVRAKGAGRSNHPSGFESRCVGLNSFRGPHASRSRRTKGSNFQRPGRSPATATSPHRCRCHRDRRSTTGSALRGLSSRDRIRWGVSDVGPSVLDSERVSRRLSARELQPG